MPCSSVTFLHHIVDHHVCSISVLSEPSLDPNYERLLNLVLSLLTIVYQEHWVTNRKAAHSRADGKGGRQWQAGFLFRGLGRCLVALNCVYLLILQENLIGQQVFVH